MTKTKNIVFLIFLFFFTLLSATAQVDKEKVALTSVLISLQEKFQCSFSFLDQELSGILVIEPKEHLNLKETIAYLGAQTPFIFTLLNDQTITISLAKKELTICGILKNIDNQKLASATITSKNHTTTSDIDGKFKLKIDSLEEIITVYYTGYTQKMIAASTLDFNVCQKIILSPQTEELEEIFLSNFMIEGIEKNMDGSINIDYYDFGILPGLIEPDLLQTIQALPGVLSVNETASNINVRGGSNDQNLLLWDGIKIYQSSHFFGLISAFNPYLTKNVRISKNGSRSEFGDGVSSVIEMNTSNKINKDFTGSVCVNLISTDAYVDMPIDNKSSLQVATRRSISDIVETLTYKRYFDKVFQDSEVINTDNSDIRFSFSDASMRWLYQVSPKDLLKINALIMQNNLIFEENEFGDEFDTSKESNAKQNNIAGGILYERIWNHRLRSELLIYGTNYNLKATNSDISNDQRLVQENDVLENGAKLKLEQKLYKDYQLITGYQFNETGISNLRNLNNPLFIDRIKEVIRTHSVFSEIEYTSPNNNSYLAIGGRINYFEKFKMLRVEPRLRFQQKFLSSFSLEILGEIKSQTTSQLIDLQNDFLGIENRRWVLSNEQKNVASNYIPIIKSKQISTGLSYKNNNWLINSDFYYKKVDGINTRSQGFQNQYEFMNDQGSYSVYGIDFLMSKRFRNFSTWFTYTYANNSYNFYNLKSNKFPNTLDIRQNINFATSYVLNNFKFSGGINWHTGKPFTKPTLTEPVDDDGTINFREPNSSRLKDYVRIDISSTYSFKFSETVNALIGVSIWNLLDQKNISNSYYRTHSDNKINEITENGLGLTPNAVLRITF